MQQKLHQSWQQLHWVLVEPLHDQLRLRRLEDWMDCGCGWSVPEGYHALAGKLGDCGLHAKVQKVQELLEG